MYYDFNEVGSGDDEKIQGVKNGNDSDEFCFTDSGDDDEEYSDGDGKLYNYSPLTETPQCSRIPEYFRYRTHSSEEEEIIFSPQYFGEYKPDRGSDGEEETDWDEENLCRLSSSPPLLPQPSKRQKIYYDFSYSEAEEAVQNKPQGPDRISSLPDPLILQIISLLPMEDAIKTGSIGIRGEWLSISIVSARVSDGSLKNGALQPPSNSKFGSMFT